MLTLIKVKVKLQPTVNCGDKISTILFKQRACRRENTAAVDTNATPQDWERAVQHGGADRGAKFNFTYFLSLHICLYCHFFCCLICIPEAIKDCFQLFCYLHTLKMWGRGRSGSSERTMNCVLCLGEALGSVKVVCLCVHLCVKEVGGVSTLRHRHREHRGETSGVQDWYDKILWISSYAASLLCWFIFLQKLCVSECANWDRSYYSLHLILSSVFISFHFICVFFCVDQCEWQRVGASKRGEEERRERRGLFVAPERQYRRPTEKIHAAFRYQHPLSHFHGFIWFPDRSWRSSLTLNSDVLSVRKDVLLLLNSIVTHFMFNTSLPMHKAEDASWMYSFSELHHSYLEMVGFVLLHNNLPSSDGEVKLNVDRF